MSKHRPQRLLLVHTGGTIASRPQAGGGATPQKTPDMPLLGDVELLEISPFCLPSPHITPRHMLELARIVKEHAHEVDGVVITHGTDTLEETAYALHLLLDVPCAVVLTGSMRHQDEASWDGPANLLDAAGVALDAGSEGRGPLVVFGGDIFDARTVTKVHSTSVDAFGGYPGPIGRIDRIEGHSHVRFFAGPVPQECLLSDELQEDLAKVEILYAYTGWTGEGFAEAMTRSNGVVIAAMGAGNLPAELLEHVKNASKPVVLATRTDAGPVVPAYGYPGGGATLHAAGAIPASFLNAQKARILLLLLLSLGKNRAEIAAAFAKQAV